MVFLITDEQGNLGKRSTVGQTVLSWTVIANLKSTVEKIQFQLLFLLLFCYGVFFLPLKCITLHSPALIFTCYLISQALSIVKFFGNFAVRLRFDRRKKKKDLQSFTPSVFVPFPSSFMDLLNSSGLIKTL